jgi:membrane fusion protein (multidrug efflux system)
MEDQTKKKSKKPLIILGALLLIMAGIGAFYWIRGSNFETTDDAQLNGNVYSVRSSVTAYLDKICFKDNQQVKKGDTLIVFNTVVLNAKVEQAKAALEQAETKLSVSDLQALASRQNAKASLQTALSGKETITAAQSRLENAQKDFNRDEELLKINAVTALQYDADKSTLAQAKADYQQAVHQQNAASISSAGLKSQANAAHHEISSAMALVAQRKAELKVAEQNYQYAFVTAPCNGIVTKRSVDPGQYVLSGQSLCAVVDADNLWVTANFKETQLHNIKPGQPVKISVDAYPGMDLKGVVESFGGATGSKFALIPPDNATGNYIKVTQRFPLRIQLKSFSSARRNEDKEILFPGLSVEVKVKTN